MNMVPFYSKDWTILGHVDMDMCHHTRTSVVLNNGPEDWLAASKLTDEDITRGVEIFHIPFREVQFRQRNNGMKVLYLVVDEETLPSWFWDAKAIVKFSPVSHQAVY